MNLGIFLDWKTILESRMPDELEVNECRQDFVTFLILPFVSVAFSDDFKTLTGKEYKDATVSRVEPDGLVLTSKTGISKVYFTELPKDVQERFGYDPQKAAEIIQHSKVQDSTKSENNRKKHRDRKRMHRKRPINTERNKQIGGTRSKCSKLATRSFRDKKTTCFFRSEKRRSPGPAYWGGTKNKTLRHYPNPQASQLPLLQSHLKDIRHEKDQVRKQLEKAQR